MARRENLTPVHLSVASTGIGGMDDILGGGLPRNHLYLIEGTPGTGKTTLGMQFLLEGTRRGEQGLYVSLSESKRELLEAAHSHGWDLEGLPILEMTPGEEELAPEAQYTVFHPADVELTSTTDSLLKHVDAINPRRIVLDSLSELRLLAREPLRYRRQILTLKRHFSNRQSTVLLLEGQTMDTRDLQLQTLAHGVISLERLERDFGTNRRRMEIRKLRGVAFREGYHDFTIGTGGINLHPRLVAAEHRPGFQRHSVPSGLKQLDALLGGGIDTGTSTLFLGAAGAGKSTIAAQYAAASAQRGELACIFSFDEIVETLVARAEALGMRFSSHIEDGTLLMQQVDPAELSPGAFVARVRSLVQDSQARVIVIDSLSGLLAAMPGEKFMTIQLHELLSFLNQQGVATIITMPQHGLMGNSLASPAVDVSYLADTVVLFRYFEAGGHVRKAISVLKRRSGAHEHTIRELSFTNGQIEVGPPLEEFQGVLTGAPAPAGRRKEVA